MRPGAEGPSDPTRGRVGCRHARHQRFLWQVLCAGIGSPVEENEEDVGKNFYCWWPLAGCYPHERPLSWRWPDRRALTAGLPGLLPAPQPFPWLSIVGVHYTILWFIVNTTTLLDTYTIIAKKSKSIRSCARRGRRLGSGSHSSILATPATLGDLPLIQDILDCARVSIRRRQPKQVNNPSPLGPLVQLT